jgi:hypothetical protein
MNSEKKKYYKYRSLYHYNEDGSKNPNQYTASIFLNGELWFAKPRSFNDPFDCSLKLHARDATDEEWDLYMDRLISQTEHSEPQSAQNLRIAKKERIWRKNKQFREVFGQDMLETHLDKSSVYCLSKKPNSVPMFSYYGDNHYGIAIELEFSDIEVPCGVS